MQVFHALFENIHVDYKYSPANQSARFAVYSVQIDNQLLSSTHPVVLCHSSSGMMLCSACLHNAVHSLHLLSCHVCDIGTEALHHQCDGVVYLHMT